MGYALGMDLGGGSMAVAVSRADRTGRHERDVVQPATAGPPACRLLERIGDPVPLRYEGGLAHAHLAVAALVAHAVDAATEREGAAPDRVLVAHPSTWGPYRRSLLLEALGQEGVERVGLIPDAVAAAVHAAEAAPTADEDAGVVAVLDFREERLHVAVVRTDVGDEPGIVLGTPRVIEEFGAADVDDAVLAHVRAVVGADLTSTHHGDPTARAAADRLRAACAAARTALLTHASATVAWELAGSPMEVRIVGAELDERIRERGGHAVTAAAEAVAAAAPGGVDRVLLLGDVAAMPLLTQLVAVEFDAPITVIDDSTHAVARGAARAARTPAPAGLVAWTRVGAPTGSPPAGALRVRKRRAHAKRPSSRRRVRAAAAAAGGVVAVAITALAISGAVLPPPGDGPHAGPGTVAADEGGALDGVIPSLRGRVGIVSTAGDGGALLAPARPLLGPPSGLPSSDPDAGSADASAPQTAPAG